MVSYVDMSPRNRPQLVRPVLLLVLTALHLPLMGGAAAAASAEAGSPGGGARWWAFQPVREHQPPPVKDGEWPLGDVDRFILAKLEAQGMVPPPAASKRVLIRRATFDLTGLPPTPEEVEAFVADASPDAFAKVVDRLLASPQYGERWGRHWLDVVRYADTSGCNGDFPAPEAWRYRNYVIDSINKDKPYDQFLREQIAGDLLPVPSKVEGPVPSGVEGPVPSGVEGPVPSGVEGPVPSGVEGAADSDERRYEQIVATGYLPISRRFSSVAEEFHLTIEDTIDNLGKAVLGLTVSCARCHDHKFDPISAEDYYALYGIFRSTKYAFPGTEIYRHPQDLVPLVPKERLEKELRPFLSKMEEMDAEMLRLYTRYAKLDTHDPEKGKLKKRFDQLQKERDESLKKLPDFPKAFAAAEGKPADARVHLKGDPEKLGDVVPRGFLTVLGGQKLPPGTSGSGRLELAGWIADPKNPLTARVMVNRVWLHHFGRGLVRTPDDFGTRSQPPTHPELLDWLARRFVDGGWSIKSLHRLIMLSRAYQSACVENADYGRRDPQNELLWTFNRRRLSAEEVRDAMLFVSGALDRSPGTSHPFKPEWEWRYTQHNPFVDDFPTDKRSVYLMQQRIRMQPYLGTFNGADTNACTGQRNSDTPPQQALFMLNSDFAHRQAKLLTERLAREGGVQERLPKAFMFAFGRPPTDDEVREAAEYLAAVEGPLKAAGAGEREKAAWASYLRVVLGSSEFVFVD